MPEGTMGNSEVGHLNLGAGRVVYQDIARIDRAIEAGRFGAALNLDAVVEQVRASSAKIHVVGLVSDGGVHSHIRHFTALFDLFPEDVPVRVHCITDGRDTSPTSGIGHLARIDGVLQAQESKYVMLHAPREALDQIAEILPGAEHPTLMELEGTPDRVAVHAVCREGVFWEHLEALKGAGASAILVLPVEKMLA